MPLLRITSSHSGTGPESSVLSIFGETSSAKVSVVSLFEERSDRTHDLVEVDPVVFNSRQQTVEHPIVLIRRLQVLHQCDGPRLDIVDLTTDLFVHC
jgi:hypothetical protein